ncbi:MAG: peptidoglycan editing factor PgeF [Anaerolineales bacterium]|nr:peptidoglycan editing factor PgeF [Anaerolineales bacterium]MCB9126413.1 peptidoglycan editing factor PgeF [Ardenticatenales bacterium]MCB9171574.1 peptidoglycan editing factor PgeF [Ardenticatenales bacterium]
MRYTVADNGVPYFQFESIPPERVAHGVFTRAGGISPDPWPGLNFSTTVGDSAANVLHNQRLAHEALGLDADRMINRHLMHTARTWHVSAADIGRPAPHADGAVSREAALSFVMTSADCQTILAYDPIHHLLAAAHAGWRGTVAGMAMSLIHAMQREGSEVAEIRVALGPAIGPCCYEVGDAVVAAAKTWPEGNGWVQRQDNGRFHFDLSAANAAIMRRVGVRHIEQSGLCTACRTDLFYSHRAEPPTTGRFALIAALRP